MDLRQVESKWQKIWADTGLYKFNRDRVDKNGTSLKCFPILRAQNCTQGTGTITDPRTPTRVSRGCRATKCFSQWGLTHSVCLRKTMR